MFVINWTRGVPWPWKWERRRDGRISYLSIRCCGVQVTWYSREMGYAVIELMNSWKCRNCSGSGVDAESDRFDAICETCNSTGELLLRRAAEVEASKESRNAPT